MIRVILFLLASAPALAAPETVRDCATCPEMVVVPAGRFVIGAPEGESENRKFGWGGPPTPVTIAKPFALGRTEVTKGQFAAFVAETGYTPDGRCRSIWEKRLPPDAQPSWRDPVWPGGVPQGGDDHPVMCIGWTDAQAYIAWLNTKAKDGRRYRLPSEAEWEYAARAGSTGRRPWDPPTGPAPIEEACRHANIGDLNYRRYIDDLPSVACDDGYPFTAPVGSFPANAFGLVDMMGNAYEWTADCWVPEHTQNPTDGRPATADEGGDCSKRTMKGGGLSSADWYLRVSTRGADPVPRTRLVVIGFRVAADLR